MPSEIHPNLALLQRLNIEDPASCSDLFADNFVWHYFNPKMPELDGDYHGVGGLMEFFGKLRASSNGAFQVNPVDARAVGDELVVVQARNRFEVSPSEGTFEFDAVVVWRIIDAKISEAWDIPAVHSVRSN